MSERDRRRHESRLLKRTKQHQTEEFSESDLATIDVPVASDRIISFMKTGFTFNWFLHPHPFVWDKNGPGLLRSKWRMTLWHLNLILTLSHCGFLLGRNIEAYMANSNRIRLEHSTTFYTLPTLFQVTILFWKKDFLNYVNESLNQTQTDQNPDRNVNWKRIKLMEDLNILAMRIIFYVLNLAASWLVVEAYMNPQAPQFLSSLWDDAEFMDIKSRILFAMVEAFLAYSNLSKSLLCLFGVGGIGRFFF